MKFGNRLRNVLAMVKKSPLEAAMLAAMVLTLGYGVVPSAVSASARAIDFPMTDRVTDLRIAAMENQLKSYGNLPESDLRGPSYTMVVPTTAYNSDPRQTDDTPFTTASGTRTRFGVVAANFLPIGTRIKIPDYYGDQIFVVEDRMNPRYDKRVDIWMEEYDDAIAWGVRRVTIEIYN